MMKILILSTFLCFQLFISSESFAGPSPLHTYIQQEIATQQAHVKKFEWNGKTLWFKRPETAKTSWYYKFLKNTLSQLVPITFLKPSPYTEETLLSQEVGRLKECEKLKLNCPRLIDQAPDWIVINNVGQPSEQVMASLPGNERLSFTINLLNGLKENHEHGFIHGRASLKDILVDKKGAMYLIDFEENPLSHLTLSDAKARDVFFFLFSALPYLDKADFQKLQQYLLATLDKTTLDSLLSITKFKWFFAIFSPLKNYLGKDPKRFFLTLDFLYGLNEIREAKKSADISRN